MITLSGPAGSMITTVDENSTGTSKIFISDYYIYNRIIIVYFFSFQITIIVTINDTDNTEIDIDSINNIRFEWKKANKSVKVTTIKQNNFITYLDRRNEPKRTWRTLLYVLPIV